MRLCNGVCTWTHTCICTCAHTFMHTPLLEIIGKETEFWRDYSIKGWFSKIAFEGAFKQQCLYHMVNNAGRKRQVQILKGCSGRASQHLRCLWRHSSCRETKHRPCQPFQKPVGLLGTGKLLRVTAFPECLCSRGRLGEWGLGGQFSFIPPFTSKWNGKNLTLFPLGSVGLYAGKWWQVFNVVQCEGEREIQIALACLMQVDLLKPLLALKIPCTLHHC